MSKKTIRLLIILLISILAIFVLTTKSNAASMSVSASKSSVSPGGTFTVTVSVSNGAGSVNVSASNGSVSSGSAWLDNSSATFTCTAGSSGTTKISVSGNFADYTTGLDEATKYGSATVTIVQPSNNSGGSSNSGSSNGSNSGSNSSSKPTQSNNTKPATTANNDKVDEQKSSNAVLSTVEIKTEGVKISPEFSKDVLEYTINIPNEINEIDFGAVAEDEKSQVVVTGNTDLKVGENIVLIEVTAEDGTKQIYTIKVIKAREKLALKTLILKYEDENGEIKELKLDPAFISNIYEYSLSDILSYKISKIFVEATANLEDASIEITGNENLKPGENIITITIRIPKEVQEPKAEGEGIEGENQETEALLEDEVITYTIKVNKEQTPSAWQNFKDKISGILGMIGNWFNNNQKPLILGSLIVCILAMVGLSIYIVFDAKKYKMLMQKLGKVSELINLENEAEVETVGITEIKPEIISEKESIQVEEKAAVETVEEETDDIPEENAQSNVTEEDNSTLQANEKIDNILENIAKEKNVEFKEEPDDGGIFGRKRGRHF